MKKFITLLLVLTGMVTTASATTYTVVFKPSSNWKGGEAKFALYMFKNGDGAKSYTSNFTETATSGIYSATYDDSYSSGIVLLRVNPAKVKSDGSGAIYGWNDDGTNGLWNQSADLDKPGSDVYYDYDGESNWTLPKKTPTSLYSPWVLAGNRHITNNYDNWNSSSSYNTMTTTDGVNYTLSVSNRPLKEGSYGFKFVGDDWYGDSGNNYILNVAADDYYDLAYSFNRISKTGSIVATAKSLSPTITYHYYVFDNAAGEEGWENVKAITGKNWTECEMTNAAGTYYYTIAGKSLTAGNLYGSRFVERVEVNGAFSQDNWLWVSPGEGGTDGCRTYDCTETTTYNIVYTFTPANSNYDITSSQPGLSVTKGFYAFNSGDIWASGKAMDFTDGVYSTTLTSMNGKNFVLAPTASLAGDAWNAAIRPMYNDDEYDHDFGVHFEKYNGNGALGGKSTWYVDNDCNIAVSYSLINNKWEVQPYRTATIGGAGYITYSNGEKCTVSGATAIYVIDANNTTSVRMKEMDASTVWPASEGMILKGDNGDEITINAVAYGTTATAIGDNYLVGSGNSEIPITVVDGHYILNWNGSEPSTVGFYSVTSAGNLGAHKAYLDISGTPAREFLDFDFGNGTTGINTLNANQKILNGEFYNLAGQRVAQPTKGLYIVNGKKVIIK